MLSSITDGQWFNPLSLCHEAPTKLERVGFRKHLVGESIYVLGGWYTPKHKATEAPVFGTLLNPTLRVSSSDWC